MTFPIGATSVVNSSSSKTTNKDSKTQPKNHNGKMMLLPSQITFKYRDFSQYSDEIIDHLLRGNYNDTKEKLGMNNSFPIKLHYMLSEIEKDGLDHIVSWQPHGRCFIVHNPEAFVEQILPCWFSQSKISSFQRQLNLYGFRRLTTASDKGAYYHELFLRGRPNLCKYIYKTKVKGTGTRKPASPELEPKFYLMPYCSMQTVQKRNGDCITVPSRPISSTSIATSSSPKNSSDNDIYTIAQLGKNTPASSSSASLDLIVSSNNIGISSKKTNSNDNDTNSRCLQQYISDRQLSGISSNDYHWSSNAFAFHNDYQSYPRSLSGFVTQAIFENMPANTTSTNNNLRQFPSPIGK